MKSILTIGLILLSTLSLKASGCFNEKLAMPVIDSVMPLLPQENGENNILTVVQSPAVFGNGTPDLMTYLSKNMIYPANAAENGISGRVYVRFVVEKDGRVTNVSVYKGVDPDLDKEAVRVVQKMPAWKPGEQDGKAVRSYYVLPISFKLMNE